MMPYIEVALIGGKDCGFDCSVGQWPHTGSLHFEAGEEFEYMRCRMLLAVETGMIKII